MTILEDNAIAEIEAQNRVFMNPNIDALCQTVRALKAENERMKGERLTMRNVLDVLRRGPKPVVCWCTGGGYRPPRHTSACKAASQMYRDLSTLEQLK